MSAGTGASYAAGMTTGGRGRGRPALPSVVLVLAAALAVGLAAPPRPSDAVAAGRAVPGTNVPGTTVPGTTVPGTSVPSTSVPGRGLAAEAARPADRPGPATRRGAAGPVAVAVGSGGTSYVGWETGGAVLRLGPDGSPRGRVRVPGDEPVTGLAVDRSGALWVDDGDTVSLLDRRGRVVRSFAHRPVLDCPAGGGAARRFGGLALGPGAVYVADRCRATVAAYSRGGVLRALLPLPHGDRASGLAWLRAGSGRPARLLVTVPSRGRLLVYDADRLADGSRPLEVRRVPRVGGGRRPEPSAVVADAFGQVVVADAANQVLVHLDADNDFRLYRVRGYPGRGGSAPGRFRGPADLAQHPQDGSGLAGNLWVADTGNGRVQRADTGTWTWWARAVRPPLVAGLPDPARPCAGTTEVRVNAGEPWTRTPQVVVRVVAPAGTEALALAGSPDLAGAVTVPLRADCGYDWRMGPGDEGVWVALVGGPADGTVLVDRIGWDDDPPRVRSARARWVRAEQRWRLRVVAVDRPGAGDAVASGPAMVLHAPRRNGSAGTGRFVGERSVLHTRDGRGLAWVRALDRAGNASDWVRVRQ